MSKNEFENCVETLRSGLHTTQMSALLWRVLGALKRDGRLNEIRLAKGPAKKIIDEVLPIQRLLEAGLLPSGVVRFPWNDGPFDCILNADSGDLITIDVTGAGSPARFHCMSELNRVGEGRGFVSLGDAAGNKEFEELMAQPRSAYSTTEAQRLMLDNVRHRHDAKVSKLETRRQEEKPDALIIAADFDALPYARWKSIQLSFREIAKRSPYKFVYLADTSQEHFNLQLH